MNSSKKKKTTQRPNALHEGLTAFCQRHGISQRGLTALTNGLVSKSSTDRLLHGTADERYVQRIKPLLITALTGYLACEGFSAEEISRELLTVFTQEELPNMIAARTRLPLEVARHFNLKRDPFSDFPRNTQETFTTRDLDRIFDGLLDAVNYQGFCAVIGDIGSGKTVLKARLMDHAGRSDKRVRLLWPKFAEMERVNSGGIVCFVLQAFEQRPSVRLVDSQRRLEKLLSNLYEQGTRVALCFDEAHHLNETVFTALKNFYELGTGGYDRFIGIVLFGQPKLKGRLNDYRFREIAERLDVLEMPPLGKAVWDYLAHRLKLVGGDIEKIFERDAVKRLAAQASTPLALGNLANAALIKAYELSERKVVAAMIKTQNEPDVRSVRKH